LKSILLIFIILLLPVSLSAADRTAYLAIYADTSVELAAGMPSGPSLTGPEIEKVESIGSMNALNPSAPRRSLDVRLWSSGELPGDAAACIVLPEGLKLGKKVDLGIYKGSKDLEFAAPGKNNNLSIKTYWGSAKTCNPSHVKTMHWNDLSAAQKVKMREGLTRLSGGNAGKFKPGWSTAFWPGEKQEVQISKDASLFGTYTLYTNYTDTVGMNVPPSLSFCNPIELTKPDLSKFPSLSLPIEIEWKPIQGIKGYYAWAIGRKGNDTLVIWNSGEIPNDLFMNGNRDHLRMNEVDSFVESKVMMPGNQTKLTLPAGVFSDCDDCYFEMVGYGPGVPESSDLVKTRFQTKTTLRILPLGGREISGE